MTLHCPDVRAGCPPPSRKKPAAPARPSRSKRSSPAGDPGCCAVCAATGRSCNWPGNRHEAFAQYLISLDNGTPVDTLRIPPGQDGVVGYNAELTGFNYDHFRVTITRTLERLALYSGIEKTSAGRSDAKRVDLELPAGLHASASEPAPARGHPPAPVDGQSGHDAGAFRQLVQHRGRRLRPARAYPVPPEQVGNLYVGPLDFAPTAAAISLARLDASADPCYPRLKDALAQAQVAVLEPGDAIYMPPVWWHHVESLERLNALVNYWWQSAAFPGHVAEPPQHALMHRILAFKSMPAAERDAWKVLLDHYVFADEDPAAHIPSPGFAACSGR